MYVWTEVALNKNRTMYSLFFPVLQYLNKMQKSYNSLVMIFLILAINRMNNLFIQCVEIICKGMKINSSQFQIFSFLDPIKLEKF